MGIDPPNCHGRSLLPLLTGERDGADHCEYALYGYFGAGVNVTDGRYTYLRPPADLDAPLYRYTTTYDGSRHDGDDRDPSEIEAASLPYTGMPVWRMPAEGRTQNEDPLLFDVGEDPRQTDDLVASRPGEHERMRELLRRGLDDLEAPDEQYERLGLA